MSKASKEASAEADSTTDKAKWEAFVLECVEACGADGCTTDEILAANPTVAYSSISARPASLEDQGLIVRGPDKRKTRMNVRAAVMRLPHFASSAPAAISTEESLTPYERGMRRVTELVWKHPDATPDMKRAITADYRNWKSRKRKSK